MDPNCRLILTLFIAFNCINSLKSQSKSLQDLIIDNSVLQDDDNNLELDIRAGESTNDGNNNPYGDLMDSLLKEQHVPNKNRNVFHPQFTTTSPSSSTISSQTSPGTSAQAHECTTSGRSGNSSPSSCYRGSFSSFTPPTFHTNLGEERVCAKGESICIPGNYSKFDVPNDTLTVVEVGIDIKDIPKIDDLDYSITLNCFFVVTWRDERMIIYEDKLEAMQKGKRPGKNNTDSDKNKEDAKQVEEWIPVDVSFVKKFWLPDAEILNLKEFKTLDVLSKLEGLWLSRQYGIMYAVATRITYICPMTFNSFPLDVQVCLFQVGSFNYDVTRMVYKDLFIAPTEKIRSVLDYFIDIRELNPKDKMYKAPTGNFSVAGFQLILRRKVSHYIITYYLPSGMFVIVSWISFLVPPDIVPGRMTLLVTVFLVLVNIFNTITTNIPKAEGLTAIEAWVIVCVLFVFGALIEYAGLLLKMKLATTKKFKGFSRENSLIVNGNLPEEKKILRGIARRRQKEDMSHARLDLLFLMLFPLFFLVFNVIYWLSYLYGPCDHCEQYGDLFLTDVIANEN